MLRIAPNHRNNYLPINTVSAILAVVPVVVILALLCAPPHSRREICFFAAGQSLSIRSILCSPISPQISSRPAASLYIACVLSCSSVLHSAFRQSGMLQFDMVQKQSCDVLAVKEVVIWIP